MTMVEQHEKTEVGCEDAKPVKAEHVRGLLLVGLFKLSKAIFFTTVGVGAFHLIHRDVGEVVARIVDALHVDTEGRFVSMIMDKADLIGHHQLRQAGFASFGYAGLCLIEGTGLIMRKGWAEYLTVVLTAGALPWEGYELMVKFTWLKVGITLLNILILLYLLFVLKQKRMQEAGAA